ncbi:MAG TPA: phosphoribosylglycinamide formyltransferase [Bacteroidales bacterium]|nr:phosphoribosylglycinamide formyltransferase [Bacteroidales bacterium]HRZ49196.1 phosphoribosylglycinamide formyltransferase [Bacteroidales bacterium]
MIQLAILASGSGTNAENIIRYFAGHSLIGVGAVISNNPQARVLEKAARYHIPARVFGNSAWEEPSPVTDYLEEIQADYLILAGFLRKIHPSLISAYPNKILNIHPALLPSYGGKGMYGDRVHEAVLANREKASGITIHLVNEVYDAGKILFQAELPVLPEDNPESLARRIHELEYRYYPKVIEQYIFPSNPAGYPKGLQIPQ